MIERIVPRSRSRLESTQSRNRSEMFRVFVFLWLITAAANAACSRSPSDAFARTVEQAASWAAAADFAAEMRQAGRVPQAYVDDLLRKGAEDLVSLQSKLSTDDDVAPSVRTRAAALCDRLASAFRAAASNANSNAAQIRSLGAELRSLSSAVRAGATEPTARGSQ